MALQTKTISANGSKGHHKFTLTVTENSTSTANNTSSVSWSLVLSPIVKNYDWNYSNTVPVTYSIVFNGTTYSGNIMSYDGTSTVTVKSGSATITHNADGNKSISYSFSVSSISASYLPGSASANGSMALTYIPRAATISSAPNFTDIQNPTITYSNPAGNAVTSLKACISLTGATDDIAYRDISKTETSYTFPLTDAEINVLMNATTDSNSRTVYFFLWTVIGGKDYRVNEPRTFSIVNADPIVTGTVTDSNDTTYALTNNRSKLIKYYSNATATISATPQKGASINESKYVIRNGSNTWDGKTHTFNNVESNVFTFYAEDSRENSTTYTLTPAPTMVNYIKLTCDISNNRPDALGNMTVACSGNYFNGSFGAASNTLAVQYRYKLSTDSWLNTEDEWHDMTITKSGNKYSATADFVIPNFGQQKIYSFQTRAIDKLSTVPSKEQSVQSMPIFHWGENDFVFEVPTTFNGDVGIKDNTLVDFVIAQGTSGNWTYRKWYSGIAECWGTFNFTWGTIDLKWETCYYSSNKFSTSYPSGLFASAPCETARVYAANKDIWPCIVNPIGTAQNTYGYLVLRSTAVSTSVTGNVSIHAIGKWK